MTNERPLVLGSGSPYRRALLQRLGLAFEVVVPDIPERRREGESPADTARRLALEKARAVAARAPASLVIGCDQVAEVGGRDLGKPLDRPRHLEQLILLSGQQVSFRTALCLLDAASGREQSEMVVTTVQFRPLAAAEIEAYVEREPALDCAGGFKCEGLGIALTEFIRGDDPTALEGLPLIALSRMLRNEGVNPLGPARPGPPRGRPGGRASHFDSGSESGPERR